MGLCLYFRKKKKDTAGGGTANTKSAGGASGDYADGDYDDTGSSCMSSVLPEWMGTKTLVAMGTMVTATIGGLAWKFWPAGVWPRKPVVEEKNFYLKGTQDAAGWAARNPGKTNLIGAGVLGTTVAATVLAAKMCTKKGADAAKKGDDKKGKKWYSRLNPLKWC